ncbi:hypothetical protein P5673_024604 [Acropora cervicornis]|uniref:Integrase core domain-containing protein n=1 Tax=Acropora cervicornis TaxID=6130 RepID=A0AAD9UXT0_ACRCE|nr:hypothetical protein P5673_024604 [Acropora cervicornis]
MAESGDLEDEDLKLPEEVDDEEGLIRGKRVPRIVVQELLREIDPEASELRKVHRLKKRKYNNPGQNYAWHCDEYDKLKPYGFEIHGCIGGWSRKMMWLYVTRSSNQPNSVAA